MTATIQRTTDTSPLPMPRLYALRGGYLLMGLGLVIVKWPLLPNASTLPLYEGVTLCLLTAMSLLALLGLRYPVAMLPILLFETIWKVLWLGLVALPHATSRTLDPAMTTIVVNCSLIVVIAAVIPWRYTWTRFVLRPADPWRPTYTQPVE